MWVVEFSVLDFINRQDRDVQRLLYAKVIHSKDCIISSEQYSIGAAHLRLSQSATKAARENETR